MSDDQDLMQLYSARILALAADIPNLGRLDAPSGSAKVRAPLCGSTVTADVTLEHGRISHFAQEVKACALGQASASVVGAHIVGRDRAEVQATRDALSAMLKDGGPVPPAPFGELEVLLPAREFKNRHSSILLALDATLAAIDDAA